jgi:hypothetical protein
MSFDVQDRPVTGRSPAGHQASSDIICGPRFQSKRSLKARNHVGKTWRVPTIDVKERAPMR